MKLASLKSSSRDGVLAVVDRNLSTCVRTPRIAPTMQQAIESWRTVAPELQAVYRELNSGKIAGAEPFLPQNAESPLPRAYHFLYGSLYLTHIHQSRKTLAAQ